MTMVLRWIISLTRHMVDEVILKRIYNDSLSLIYYSLMSFLSLISLWFWNFFSDVLIQVIFFKYRGDSILPCLKVINSSTLVLKQSMVSHFFQMRT